MEWVVGIQKAIDYIEDHITDELAYGEIAKIGFAPSYHFQRVFSILCGYTLEEYIRNRRLTLAGMELAANKSKVIDVAIKYGYDSSDSFAKVFFRFHGISPSAAREPEAKLCSFTRLSIRSTLEGGNSMDYRIEEKPEMVLTGLQKIFYRNACGKDCTGEGFLCKHTAEPVPPDAAGRRKHLKLHANCGILNIKKDTCY